MKKRAHKEGGKIYQFIIKRAAFIYNAFEKHPATSRSIIQDEFGLTDAQYDMVMMAYVSMKKDVKKAATLQEKGDINTNAGIASLIYVVSQRYEVSRKHKVIYKPVNEKLPVRNTNIRKAIDKLVSAGFHIQNQIDEFIEIKYS